MSCPTARRHARASAALAAWLALLGTFSPHATAAGPQIAGTVTYYGHIPGAHTIYVSAHRSLSESPAGSCSLPSPGGSYAIGGLANGSYYVGAFLDANDTGGGPPDPGEATGWYDPDANGDPDTVQVVGGALASGVDIALGNIHYVQAGATGAGDGTSWADAFTRVQDALAVAAPGEEIWVAQGVYTPTTPSGRDACFYLEEGRAVYGGFAGNEDLRSQRDWAAHPTVLSGDIGAPGVAADNSYHVVFTTAVTRSAVLDGFTISGGQADGAGIGAYGGGLCMNSPGSPTLRHIVFRDNVAVAYGGGVYSMADMTLRDVSFISNTASLYGGGMYSDEGSPSLAWTTFVSNGAQTGGGLYLHGGNPQLANANFRGNLATQHGAGLYAIDGHPVLANAAFSGNVAGGMGGGAHIANGAADVHNASFAGNGASSGGALYLWSNVTALYNTILWGNTATSGAQIQTGGPGSTTVSYSIVQGAYAGSHVLGLDPCFVNAVGPDGMIGTGDDDLRLRAGSPAIDAGDNTALPPDLADLDGDGNTSEPVPVDLAGNGRRTEAPAVPNTGNGLGMIVDMGAFEYPWQPIELPLVIR